MTLCYKGFDRSGSAVQDKLDARDIADATEILRRRGIYVTSIDDAVAEHVIKKTKTASIIGQGGRLKSVAMFFRQLHVLIATGTPLAESLSALERQSTDAGFKAVVQDIREKVEQGTPLSSALEDHPRYFNAVSRGLIAAGESGGNLDAMLERLAVLSRKQLHVRGAVSGAMIYPCLLTFVAMAVLITLLVFVLPRFSALFATLDTPLPPTTKMLMGLSDFVRTYWWSCPIMLAIVIGATWTFLRTPAGKRSMDYVMLFVPQMGGIIRNFAVARIARLLGILLLARVPLLEALALTRAAMGNYYYQQLLANAGDAISRGESLGSALSDKGLVPPSICEAVRSGDKSGQLGKLLSTLADFLDEENEVTLRTLTSVMEPFILLVLGLLVGFIALSMFHAAFRSYSGNQGLIMRFTVSSKIRPIGLDLGVHSFKAVQVQQDPGGWKLINSVSLPRVNHTAPLQTADLIRFLKVLDRRGFTGRDAVTCVPTRKLLTAMLELPARGPGVPLEQIAAIEFARVHKQSADALTIATWELPMPARATKATYMLGVGANSSELESHIDLIESAGFNVVALEEPHTAAARGCLHLAGALNGLIGIIDLGWSAITLTILRDKTIVYTRKLSDTGLSSICRTASEDADIDLQTAQDEIWSIGFDSKRLEMSDNREALEAVGSHFVALVKEIMQAFSYVSNRYSESGVAQAILIGGGAAIPGISQRFELQLGIPCIIGSTQNGTSPTEDAGPALNACLGMALWKGEAA